MDILYGQEDDDTDKIMVAKVESYNSNLATS
jgi:hypothetical protein